MNKLIPIVMLGSLLSSPISFAEDEYDYIPTPIGEQVDDLKDDDSDGVINARDLCPGTPIEAEINNDGCGARLSTESRLELRILFPNDSDEINPVFSNQIEEMANFLAEFPTTSIEIQGYASKTGSAEYNVALSERRATAVQDELLSFGVQENRVAIVGFGDTKLADENDSEVSHALNRRVTATVVGYKGEVKKRWTIFTTIEK
ncbi:OmpA family protein [Vibrio maerlii]|uniref:OmpA family protein n=1 Tax=Vibrio maerlii TaxID=2231648 RepID=UPI000E3E5355|nr:OmpA family protein [Vibrio maerlii]